MDKSTLHVLTLTPFFPSDGDDVSGCFIAESTRELERFGVTSSVIAASPVYYARKKSSLSTAARWVRYPQIPGIVGLSSAGRWLYARLLREVRLLHKRKPIDVIHAHAALPCGHAASLLSRRLNIPFVVTLHGLDVFNTCFMEGTAARWRRAASIDVYRAARKVVCVSQKVERLLREGMGENVCSAVAYNGTDTDLFVSTASDTPSQPQDEILVVGNLIEVKGHELVLRAIAQIASSFPHVRCRIIGEGPDLSRLQALTQELNIAERVQFEGRRSRKDVADAMRACSVFVLPSRYEGLGCVYLEAMACGKPVIACRGQGIDEIIKHEKNGWLIAAWAVPSDVHDELARGISTLLQSAELRARLGACARQTVRNGLTLSDQAQRLVHIYREAIA